jgi:hypothetical protein
MLRPQRCRSRRDLPRPPILFGHVRHLIDGDDQLGRRHPSTPDTSAATVTGPDSSGAYAKKDSAAL